ncbi:MAG: AbrB/MazE/SpoVT family DNA-binding domain-containing protein [Nitrospirae bacterium]|nr:AbrB/MazE/SpoVT family DNA-binding domain-containing protein [Nitrospirota bacterium]
MSLVKVKRFAQVTIPADIRQKAHIDEGDYVEVKYEGNKIVIIPKRISDKSVDWTKRFDEAVSEIRKIAKKTGITEKKVDEAVKAVRQRTSR